MFAAGFDGVLRTTRAEAVTAGETGTRVTKTANRAEKAPRGDGRRQAAGGPRKSRRAGRVNGPRTHRRIERARGGPTPF